MPSSAFSSLPTILIVDDQPSDALILKEAVADLGDALVARDGSMALDIARFRRPDLILLDIQLPGTNGFELCRQLKADPKLCDAAVMFVTSHTQADNEIRALELGGVDFIQKPLSIPVVRAHVKAHLNLRNEAKRLAYFDALTGLPNRSLLMDRATQAMQKAHRNMGKVALLLLDLDNFKGINDTMGHAQGDAVLKEIAARLSRCVRSIDTIGRPGGDEFVILLPEVTRLESVSDFAERVLQTLATPMRIDNNRYDLSASMGISIFPDDSDDLESLYRHADSAMYLAKKQGRNRYRFFSQAIESSSRARHLLEGHMRRAVEQGVFEVFYQLKRDTQHNRPCGIEALIRWRKADGTLISPNDFIPLAEETGLIVQIGKQVLVKACNDAQRLRAEGLELPVSVNISTVQFREEAFLAMVTGILEQTGLPPHLLELEITEGVLAEDIVLTRQLLKDLKALGINIAIDDFGTGYSSLLYLKQLPIDVLKIDQSFVRDMLVSPRDTAIVEAIIRLAQALHLDLVAEGVEAIEQAQRLQELGCSVMQGYLYARPVPFDDLVRSLLDHAERQQSHGF